MKGDPGVVDCLNRALRLELTAVNRYWMHFRLTEDWGFARLARRERARSIEEMRCADRLVDRIILLDGFPDMQQLNPLRIGRNVAQVLESDRDGEYAASAYYAEAREICRMAGDAVSMNLFADFRAAGQGHVDFLENELQLLADIGMERYGQLNADPAEGETV